jgi:hypothetical protein
LLKKTTKKLLPRWRIGAGQHNPHAPGSENFFGSFFIKKELLAWLSVVLISACTAPDSHAPVFAQRHFAPFSRADAIAVAMDEWRLWGMRIDDDWGAGYLPSEATMPQRQPGLWQRVGEYWWEGMNAAEYDNAYTGKYDAAGSIFPIAERAHYAWSAAFISYVMRMAGAGERFPYAPDHAFYINYAAGAAEGQVPNPLLIAENPTSYAPRLGDLLCFGRGPARGLSFADLPTSSAFPAHCGIVVAGRVHQLSVIGGNVENAVALQHVPATDTGLVGAPWLVVLRVMYQR